MKNRMPDMCCIENGNGYRKNIAIKFKEHSNKF